MAFSKPHLIINLDQLERGTVDILGMDQGHAAFKPIFDRLALYYQMRQFRRSEENRLLRDLNEILTNQLAHMWAKRR